KRLDGLRVADIAGQRGCRAAVRDDLIARRSQMIDRARAELHGCAKRGHLARNRPPNAGAAPPDDHHLTLDTPAAKEAASCHESPPACHTSHPRQLQVAPAPVMA